MNNQITKTSSPFTLALLRRGVKLRSTGFEVRRAVRAVVNQADRFLLVHSTVNGDYKFPGGGVQPGERHRDTLSREMHEETGYRLHSVNALLGVTTEIDLPLSGVMQPFRMVSFYYSCDINPERGIPEPDIYEEELGFQSQWVTLNTALRNNRRLLRTSAAGQIFWLARETAVLQRCLSLFYGESVS